MKLHSMHGPSGSRRGSAIVMSLIVVTVVASLGATFLMVSTATTRRQFAETENIQAFYLAEAGLAEAFQAVRMGRSGQIGSQFLPARYADGLLWVDATMTVDDQVRLESTALCGSGRATLALIVEPVQIELGFFADEDLVVEDVILVDGFDSVVGTYEEQAVGGDVTVDPCWPFLHDDRENGILFYEGAFYRYQDVDCDTYHFDHVVSLEQLAGNSDLNSYDIQTDDFMDEMGDEAIATMLGLGPEPGVLDPISMLDLLQQQMDHTGGSMDQLQGDEWSDDDDDEGESSPELESLLSDPTALLKGAGGVHEDFSDIEYQGVLAYFDSVGLPGGLPGGLVLSGPTTGGGALMGSNGNVRFASPSGVPLAVFGDVHPGPHGTVQTTGGSYVGGNTGSRAMNVDLPEVDIPSVPLADSLRHDDMLPMMISAGVSGYEGIAVAAGAELVLRGPSTVVIGELTLEPGALLTLDTRDGDVSLYVTGGLDFQSGSLVQTSGDYPEDLTIQVGQIGRVDGQAPVNLDATSQFYGTIYSPQADVRVGSDFEVFGAIVAQRLELAPGARLHFDNAGFENSPIPRLVSWRIIEVPAEARARRRDPFELFVLPPDEMLALASAHDLDAVLLSINYIDHSGIEQRYYGAEDGFDWQVVATVVSESRDAVWRNESAGPESLGDGGLDRLAAQRSEVDADAPVDPASVIASEPVAVAPEAPAVAAPVGVRQQVFDGVMDITDNTMKNIMQNLEAFGEVTKNCPLSADEWSLILNRTPPVPQLTIDSIRYVDDKAIAKQNEGTTP